MRRNDLSDLTGNPYGKLTVLRFSHTTKSFQRMWRCQCQCGKQLVLSSRRLCSAGQKSCRECSSTIVKDGQYTNKHPAWKGHGEISKTYMSHLKKMAEERHIPFNVTMENIWRKFLDQDGKCALSGVSLIFGPPSQIRLSTASLDRIDSGKNYDISNVQWVHKQVNMMKQSLTNDEFLEWCKKIVANKDNERIQKVSPIPDKVEGEDVPR